MGLELFEVHFMTLLSTDHKFSYNLWLIFAEVFLEGRQQVKYVSPADVLPRKVKKNSRKDVGR